MIKWLMHRKLKQFEATFGYDASHMHDVIDIWPKAAMRYQGISAASQLRGPEVQVWAGAAVASILDGDCGPCAQLVIDIALQSGVNNALLAACLRRDFQAADQVGLGFRFAEAAINDLPELDELRDEIRQSYGEQAVIAATYAAAVHRVYPVIKRGLGYGKICQQIKLGGQMHSVVRQQA